MAENAAGAVWLVVAGLVGATGVIAGAAVAHGGSAMPFVEIGARYQQTHALALLGVALLVRTAPSRWVTAAGVAFVLGCLLFSGGLYLRSAGIDAVRPAVPIGGTCFIAGWLLLAAAGVRAWRRGGAA